MLEDSIIVELGQVREIPQHIHGGIEIFLSMKGSINLTIDGVSHFLRQNDIVLCNSGEAHSASGMIPNIALRVLISEDFLNQETRSANAYFYCNSCQMTESERELAYGQLRQMLMHLAQSNYRKNEYMQLDFKSAALRLLSFLFKNFRVEKKGTPIQIDDCADQRIIDIISRINKNYNTDISLHKIAEEEHLSVHYLSRLFKKKTGVGFMEYLGQLRLAGAVNHLLHTDWPIIKIALANGFSNVGSFNKLFMKRYGQSPSKFRAPRKAGTQPIDSEMGEVFKNIDDIVRYLRTFDVKFGDAYSENVHLKIDADAPVCEKLRVIGRVIRVGRMSELLKTEVRTQLKTAKDKVLAEYAHFIYGSKDGMQRYHIHAYANYEYFQVLDYLYSIGVKPFFSISAQGFIDETPDATPEKWGEEILRFLQDMVVHFPAEYTDAWMFEIDFIQTENQETFWGYYRAFRDAIRQVLPAAKTGLQFIENITNKDGDYRLFTGRMKQAGSEEILPSFIAYYSEWWKLEQFIESSENYVQYKNYIATQIENLVQRMRETGLDSPRVLLMDWNVLAGFTSVESNAFFRSALYADGFLNIGSYVTDVAYWLNAYVHEASSGRTFFEIPSLFLFGDLKRSIFFSLIVLDQIYPDVTYHDDNVVVTKNNKGDFAILVMNACYFAPKLALDSAFTGSLKRIFSIQLENIHGEKTIERYLLDSERTSLYSRWVNMGLPNFVDRNVIEQLNRATNFDYVLFEEKLDGSYMLSVALDFNELAVINIRNKQQ